MAEISKQMLDYSGKGRFLVKPLNLSDLVAGVASLLGVTLPKKVALKLELGQDLPAVEASGDQLRQIILNLVINAAEAVGEQVGLVTIKTGSINTDHAFLSKLQRHYELREPVETLLRSGAGQAVLVVDDEETVRTTATMLLKRVGFTVMIAMDGEEALKLLSEHPRDIDVVLLDLSMPKMDGVETFVEIRKSCPHLPIVLSSGCNEQDATQAFTGKGLSGFIQKPYDIESLSKTILEAWSNRKQLHRLLTLRKDRMNRSVTPSACYNRRRRRHAVGSETGGLAVGTGAWIHSYMTFGEFEKMFSLI